MGQGRVRGKVRWTAFVTAVMVASVGVSGSPATAVEAPSGVSVPAATAAATGDRPLGPVSTAAIGGVLVAVAFWARSRSRARVPA